jgi:GntR family transcriptional regulator
MLIRIDPQSPEPIFEQVVYQVKGLVARGDLVEGDRLPSVRELAKQIAVNPNTVIRAYEALEHDGLIVRRQGAGCFVTANGSTLKSSERTRQLKQLMRRTVTDAFHLGFKPQAIRKALEEGLAGVRFKERKQGS